MHQCTSIPLAALGLHDDNHAYGAGPMCGTIRSTEPSLLCSCMQVTGQDSSSTQLVGTSAMVNAGPELCFLHKTPREVSLKSGQDMCR